MATYLRSFGRSRSFSVDENKLPGVGRQVTRQQKQVAKAGGAKRNALADNQYDTKKQVGATRKPAGENARQNTRAVRAVASSTSQNTRSRLRASASAPNLPALVQQPIPEITKLFIDEVDRNDAQDAQNVVPYLCDIYAHLRKNEAKYLPSSDYISGQPNITEHMRATLIDWLVEVHLAFKLRSDTLFLAINYVDRYLSAKQTTRQRLQLIGITCMLLASKYEEIWAPYIKDFVNISDRAYNREQILQMERHILSTLQFNLTVGSPLLFARRFAKISEGQPDTNMLVKYMLELSLVHYITLQFTPSVLAAGATYLARMMTHHTPWSPLLEKHTGYKEEDLIACARVLRDLVAAAPRSNLASVRRKYNRSAFLRVASIQPPAVI